MTDRLAASFRGLFEAHLHVADLNNARRFYEDIVGLEVGFSDAERRAIFYWVGSNRSAMLGVWERPPWLAKHEQRDVHAQHLAFEVGIGDLHGAIDRLKAQGVQLHDFFGNVTEEPTVFGWIPAASIYFRDADGNLLELIGKLDALPQPQIGIVRLSEWRAICSGQST